MGLLGAIWGCVKRMAQKIVGTHPGNEREFTGRIKLIAGFMAALLFLGGLTLNVYTNSRSISKRLSDAEQTIKAMKREHDFAIEAANAALKAREEEHARNQERIAEAERVLEENADFGSLVLPDDVARLLRKDGSADADAGASCGLPAPGGAAR